MKKPKNCRQCGAAFMPAHMNEVYCGNECRSIGNDACISKWRKTRRGQVQKRKCVECGKEFQPVVQQTKICSKECVKKRHKSNGNRHYRKLVMAYEAETECASCGRHLGARRYKHRFCNASCSDKHRADSAWDYWKSISPVHTKSTTGSQSASAT